MQEKIGFWAGLGMAWTSLVQMIVMLLRAGETTATAALNVAQSGEAATQVLKANVNDWVASDPLIEKQRKLLASL